MLVLTIFPRGPILMPKAHHQTCLHVKYPWIPLHQESWHIHSKHQSFSCYSSFISMNYKKKLLRKVKKVIKKSKRREPRYKNRSQPLNRSASSARPQILLRRGCENYFSHFWRLTEMMGLVYLCINRGTLGSPKLVLFGIVADGRQGKHLACLERKSQDDVIG